MVYYNSHYTQNSFRLILLIKKWLLIQFSNYDWVNFSLHSLCSCQFAFYWLYPKLPNSSHPINSNLHTFYCRLLSKHEKQHAFEYKIKNLWSSSRIAYFNWNLYSIILSCSMQINIQYNKIILIKKNKNKSKIDTIITK